MGRVTAYRDVCGRGVSGDGSVDLRLLDDGGSGGLSGDRHYCCRVTVEESKSGKKGCLMMVKSR